MATEIIKKPAVWFVIGLIPIVNILFCIEYAKAFGKGAGFGIGLALVPFVFYPMLAWGDATYQLGSKPGVAAAA